LLDEVPAAVVGEAGDGIAAFAQQRPQLFRRPHAARETAAHRDDGDRLVKRVCKIIILLT